MMTTPTQNLARAARAFRLALSVTEDAGRIAGEFPAASRKLAEAAKVLIAEGRKAEAHAKGDA